MSIFARSVIACGIAHNAALVVRYWMTCEYFVYLQQINAYALPQVYRHDY